MKDEKALDNLIEGEQKKLAKLEEKQVELAKKIKSCKTTIEKYTLMKNNKQFVALSTALENKGLSIEDILSAVAAGELNSLASLKPSVEEKTDEIDDAPDDEEDK